MWSYFNSNMGALNSTLGNEGTESKFDSNQFEETDFMGGKWYMYISC